MFLFIVFMFMMYVSIVILRDQDTQLSSYKDFDNISSVELNMSEPP